MSVINFESDSIDSYVIKNVQKKYGVSVCQKACQTASFGIYEKPELPVISSEFYGREKSISNLLKKPKESSIKRLRT